MKAMLIVDIPDDVNVDINNLIVKDITFKDTSSDLGITYTIHKPKISIKPMPQKKEAFEECMKFGMMTDKISEAIVWQVQGYNYCIDEILGGEE